MAVQGTHETKDSITHLEQTTPIPEPRNVDTAAKWLADTHIDNTPFSYEEERAVLKRIDYRVLPLLLGAYFFQQLDKSSLSYVSIFGLQKDAGLVGRQYSWLGSILYLAQLVMQPLAAFLLVKLPTGKVIAGAIFLWGSSLAMMAACTDFRSLLGLRFVLGTFEAMIAPACVATTSMWWRRSEQTLRTAYWNAMNGVTYIVGSLFTYGLGHISSDVMHKYQIIFLFCGLLTVVYSLVVLVLMPDSPMKAKYLTEREKIIAIERLRANQMGIQSGHWRWDQVWETFYDFKTWCWFLAIVAISIASGGISTFGSLIIKDFGYTNFEAILFNIPFGVIQIVAILASSYGATRFKRKGMAIALVAILPVIGTVMMLTVPRKHKGVLLFGYYLVSCLAAITPIIYTWHVQNTAGDTKKKCTSAMVFIGMCTGNVIGPLLYSVDDAPLYRPGLISNLVMFVLVGIIALLIPVYLALLNKRHALRREELGKSAVRLDESMLKKEEITQVKGVEMESGEAPGLERDNGFLDLTDMKNEDFIYVY
ncbi:MFS allantoate transporter-like protein [Dothidotthia symphoricarpi CBS 119687]|uniref:MFS allantoate transporter-like protein n=1 Tax=Dothidotthia symphoricarpi CBS 119687 TaxID=1392245 RepID=A0A6A6A8Q5_9PLEO|nr:MFS allantoate transporter-like protein [Dothidotthia symphoricarpi CBS 119687]KAF2128220.1 MFS allantoate transporter-like protein [Dothidotthia symphoricarpi CBS 119687]